MINVYVNLIIKGKRNLSDVKPKALYEEVCKSLINKYVELIKNLKAQIEDVPIDIAEEVKQKLCDCEV